MGCNTCIMSPLRDMPRTTLMGEVSVPAPNRHFRRTPDEWIFYFVRDGHMKLEEEGKIYDLMAGDVLFLSPGKCHDGLAVNDRVGYYYIHFRWDSLQEVEMQEDEYQNAKMEVWEKTILSVEGDSGHDVLLLPKIIHLPPFLQRELTEDVAQLISASQRVSVHQHSMCCCRFLALLLKMSQTETERLLPDAPSSFSYTVPIMAYLKKNYGEKITGEMLEKHFHHNFDYMNRKFKENTGYTIFQYLERFRIGESRKLLESKRFTIAEIAGMLGYCNAFYFTKVFRKYENMTPSEYRKRH